MYDMLSIAYPWIKSIHIMAVIAWMAGLFYLPRLYVHHSERVGLSGETHDLFAMMENKLLRLIMNPAMIATWIFGLCLVLTPGIVDWSFVWPWIKMVSVIAMTAFHMWLAGQRRKIAGGGAIMAGRTYRLMNEVPTVLMIAIVLSVVVKF